jgi:hypothetical protein
MALWRYVLQFSALCTHTSPWTIPCLSYRKVDFQPSQEVRAQLLTLNPNYETETWDDSATSPVSPQLKERSKVSLSLNYYLTTIS